VMSHGSSAANHALFYATYHWRARRTGRGLERRRAARRQSLGAACGGAHLPQDVLWRATS